MKDELKKLIKDESKKNPLTDSELAKILNSKREIVSKCRKELGIEDSRERRKPLLVNEIEKLLSRNCTLSERELTSKLNERGFDISRHSVRSIKKEYENHKDTSYVNKNQTSTSVKGKAFENLIGYDGCLKPFIQQAKAAMLYPPNGVHTLILGPTGVGKSELAEAMYQFSKEKNMVSEDSSLIVFNCADYADNPQLLMAQLFGYVKGAFTGAESDKAGLVEKADGGILFLDEVHRLPPEGQELLFYLIDKNKFRRLGETNVQRQVKVTIIAATTENADSMLLTTFRRRIPMVIELPPLESRPLNERYEIIRSFFSKESDRIQNAIKVYSNVVKAFLMYDCQGNVGQLRSDIQVSCAKGFLNYVTNNLEIMEIKIDDVPMHTKKGLLKIQNYRKDLEKVIKIEEFIIHPNQEKIPLDMNHDMYEMPFEIYEYIERRYKDLQNQFSNQEVINYIIGNEMQSKVETLLKNVSTSVKPIDKKDLINIVGIKVVEVVDRILRIASYKLGVVTEHLYYVMAIHLSTTLQRLNSGKTIINPQLNQIQDKYHGEYKIAEEMVEVINEEFDVQLTDDEVGFITMYLYSVVQKDEAEPQGNVGVLVASHGNVSYAMLEVAHRLLGVNFAKAVDMSLDESPEAALERTIEVVKSMDEGKGVLLLVDMGSLVTFGEIITQKTGIKTRSISRVDTVMVIEAIRKAMLPQSNLDDIANTLEEESNHISRLTIVDKKQKPNAVITICITGHGSAVKIKELLENAVKKHDENVKVIPIGAIEANIKNIIDKVQKEYRVVAIVGTVNPHIPNMTYISLEEIIKKNGMQKLLKAVSSKLESDILLPEFSKEKYPKLDQLVHSDTIMTNLEVETKENIIEALCNQLYEKGYVAKRFHQSVLERESFGPTFFLNGTSIPHGEPMYVKKQTICLGILKEPVDWDGVSVKVVLMLAFSSECMNVITRLQELCSSEENIGTLISGNKEKIIQLFKQFS